jgi:spoIIIJ-associated protein
MIDKKIKIIEGVSSGFFSSLGFESEAEVREDPETGFWVNIEIDEPGVLIGKGGQNLADIQHLLRLMINKKLGEFVYLSVDINNYKKAQEEEAKKIADKAIKEVLELGEAKVLNPMSSYMRKLIHIEVKNEPRLTSRSIGEDLNRRVMIEFKKKT